MMHRIDPLLQSWPLFDVAASRAIEQAALAARPAHSLMRNAGEAVARLALAIAPHGQTIWVAAGPGNNGGDGLEAAMHLQQAGKQVAVTLHGDPKQLPADAADALARAQAAGVRITSGVNAERGSEELVVDALLGLGASRPPQGEIAAAIERIAQARGEVLAVDIPSGLHPATGQPLGRQAVIATHTLALLSLKPGLYTAAGRDHAGEVWLATLSVEAPARQATAMLAGGPAVARQAARTHAQHKGSFGDVHVVGGAPSMTGAALLAARAALAAGAGRVYVNLLDGGSLTHDIVRPELMFRPDWWQSGAETLAKGCVLCGCGGGEAVREALPALLVHASRLVLDADALNAIAADNTLQQQLAARQDRGQASILTPHPLEAARLMASTTHGIQADRLGAARALADRYRCVVVLKSSGSIIASPGAVSHVNPTGNASLATAGTGDVLGGWLAGLWAGARDELSSTAHEAAVRAVFQHGLAAETRPGPAAHALRAADLIERLYRLD